MCDSYIWDKFQKWKQQHPIKDESGNKLNFYRTNTININGNKMSILDLLDSENLLSYFLLNVWEIRNYTHMNDPDVFNIEKSSREDLKAPPFGMFVTDRNPLFPYILELKKTWKEKLIFNSYFLNNQFKVLKILKQGKSLASLFSDPDHSRHYSSGLILEETIPTTNLKNLHICFRETTGSLQMAHWFQVTKGKYVNIDGNGVWIHQGVWNGPYTSANSIESIRTELLDFIDTNETDYENIIISGMSLGGALAQCAALDLCAHFTKGKIILILFGSPRVYEKSSIDFLLHHQVSCLRIEGNKDCVAGFPYSSGIMPLTMNWKHYGIPIRLNVEVNDYVLKPEFESGKFNLNVTDFVSIVYNNEIDILLNRLPLCLLLMKGPLSTKNFHTSSNYLKSLLSYYIKNNGVDLLSGFVSYS
jgi:hypothetical protein